MSKKFTGITSAGSAIPVYDKDAHSALEQKLDIAVYSAASGNFLTAVPDEYAKTSAVEDMVSAASADLNTAIGNKLDISSFADVSGSFLTEVPESAVSGFATHEEVESATSGKADTSAIPSLDGYATQEWVGEQGYLTEVPESAVSGFATHEEVDEATSGKMDVSGLASGQTASDVWNRQTVYSAYNGIPFYAGYKLDVSAATAVSPNFNQNNDQNNGYAKFSGYNENVGIDISGARTNKRIYITDEGITLSGYSSQSDADRNINGHYLNITPENYVDKTKFKNIVASDNEIYVPNDVKTVSGNYDMQYYNYSFIGDFSGNDNLGKEFTVTLPVATTSFRYTACEQDWNWLYEGSLTSEEPKTVWKITPDKDYTAKQDYAISTGTFYTFQITQSPFPGGVVSASLVTWNDEVFATRPWVEEQLSANVPQGVMETSGLEYDGDKISGYMGSAFAGGGDVPEGVMVESAVGYNAVNEISGYNGSAIAQYGAEKQWLVHDDTLVHAANSAQYALGVNVSAVQTLMGFDETVLFSGNLTGNGATAQLSEPITNFERIKVYGHTDDGLQCPWFTEFYPIENTLMDVGVAANNAGWGKWFNFTITTGGLYTNVTGRVLTFGSTTWGNLNTYGMTRVVGIGRKS